MFFAIPRQWMIPRRFNDKYDKQILVQVDEYWPGPPFTNMVQL